MQYATLSNGLQMPMLGYGVFQIDNDTTEQTVEQALRSGYRLIDTAQAYQNELGVGEAMKRSGVAREDIFLVTKVWPTNFGEGRTYASIKESLERLGTDYIDLLLIHQPFNDYYAAWRDMEKAYDEGLVKAIGVSNFDSVRLLDLATFARIKPMVNQVEAHVFRPQLKEVAFMKELGVVPMAWGPFAEGSNGFFSNPVLTEIAQEQGKALGQVALRYLMENGLVVIPKTVRAERMVENLDVFDFQLTAEDHQRIEQLAIEGFAIFDHSDTDRAGGLIKMIKANI